MQRRPQVVVLGEKAAHPIVEVEPRRVRLGRFCQPQVVISMTGSDQFDLVCFFQIFSGELADRLQHPVARLRLVAPVLEHDERAVGQRRQQFEAGGRADGERRLDVEATGENRELTEKRALGVEQQLVTPVEGGGEGRLPLRCRTRSAGQQREVVLQTLGDVSRVEGAHTRCRQLDGEWQAVQPAADGADGLGALGTKLELRPDVPGTIGEQLDRIRLTQRRHRPYHLAGDRQRLPAGGDDLERRSSGQKAGCDLGRRLHQVLAVVDTRSACRLAR